MKNKLITSFTCIIPTAIVAVLWFNNQIDNITAICCIAIILFFCYYCHLLITIQLFTPNKEQCRHSENLNNAYNQLENLNQNYSNSLTIQLDKDSNKKTNVHAEDVYSTANVARAINVNLKTVHSAPGVLSGLGVLGTFIGLAIGIGNFDSQSTSSTLKSIEELMNGMNTAFYTSIAGMALSVFFIIWEKKVLNNLYHATATWCNYLDKLHFISEVDVLRYDTLAQQRIMMEKLSDIHLSDQERNAVYQKEMELIKNQLDELCISSKENVQIYKESIEDWKKLYIEGNEALKEVFIGYDEDGEKVLPGPILVQLYEESEKQSQALESFTTDLSNELNSSLGKTMDTSIVPLIHNLEKTHQVFNDKLELLATNIQTPATDMITTVVDELKSSMTEVTQEFKDNISNDTINHMNLLAANLAEASQVLNSIPSTMQGISDNITLSFGNVKDIIGQLQISMQTQQQLLLEGTQHANKEMNENMKLQFNEMVTTLAGSVNSMNNGVTNNIDQARSIINQIQNDIKEQQEYLIQHTYQANEAMVNGMRKQFEEMMSLLTSSVSSLNSQQNDLIEGQGKSSKEIERLLFSFDESIKKVRVSNQEISRTLVSLQGVGENMNKSAERLNDMSNQMTTINNELQVQHQENIKQFHKIQEGNQDTLETIATALDNSKSILEKYTEQYDIINEGLENIFKQIDEGLKGYSSTLKESTKDALAEYSNALTESTQGLRNIAEALNDTVEELNDSIDKIKIKFK